MEYEAIKPYIEKKLVSEQVHTEDPNVRIFNYTQNCQFEQAWDDITRQCRGLILNVRTGEVLARPFPKFFNYGEHVSKGWAIPTGTPIVSEKLDGSLGILYQLGGKPWIATRGSFTSDQALWATDWYRKNIGHDAPKDETVLFEIIYPANRIVVSYDFSALVFLTSLDIKTGLTVNRRGMFGREAKEIPYTDMETLEKMDEPNSEGFVLYYPADNVRMKIKFAEYVRLHRIVTGVNEIAIWEMLRDGKPLQELLEKVPDEFFKWVDSVAKRLVGEYNEIAIQAERDFQETYAWAMDAGHIYENNDQNGHAYNRKEIALYFQKKKNPGILFALLDGKPWQPIVWKMVRPHGAKVFKTDIDL